MFLSKKSDSGSSHIEAWDRCPEARRISLPFFVPEGWGERKTYRGIPKKLEKTHVILGGKKESNPSNGSIEEFHFIPAATAKGEPPCVVYARFWYCWHMADFGEWVANSSIGDVKLVLLSGSRQSLSCPRGRPL